MGFFKSVGKAFKKAGPLAILNPAMALGKVTIDAGKKAAGLGGNGGGGVKGPGGTEAAIMAEQLDLLRQQRAEIEDFKPFILKQYGYETDPATGKYRKTQQQQNIEQSLMDRKERALRGDTTASAGLSYKKQEDFAKLKEAQARAGNVILGDTPESAVGKSTGAQEALGLFNRQFQEAQQRENDQIINNELSRPVNDFNASSYTGLLGAYNGVLQPYQQNRQMQMQQDQYNSSQKNNQMSGLLQLGGTLGAAYLTGGSSLLAQGAAGAAGGQVGGAMGGNLNLFNGSNPFGKSGLL